MLKTTIALTNNVVGSTILILPLLFLNNQLPISIALVLLTGFYNYYSCKLTLDHLGEKQKYYSDAINRHYRKQVFPLYQICCFISNELIFYMYFNLLLKQWTGLLYRHTQLIPWLPYLALLSLVIITIALKGHHSGVTLMAIGISSTLFFCFFIGWLFVTRPLPRVKQFPLANGGHFLPLANALGAAFSTQTTMIQILQVNRLGNNSLKTVGYTFILSGLIYLFIGLVGGLAIIDLVPIYKNAETINQYFYEDRWQQILLQILYILHIYSVWPQWIYINSDRLMKLLNTERTKTKETVYIIVNGIVSCFLQVKNVNILTFVDLNGGICQCIIAYLIPIYIHIKCRHLYSLSPLSIKSEENVENPPNIQNQGDEEKDHQQDIQRNYPENDQKCKAARALPVSWFSTVVEILIISTMLFFGCSIMILTIWESLLKDLLK